METVEEGSMGRRCRWVFGALFIGAFGGSCGRAKLDFSSLSPGRVERSPTADGGASAGSLTSAGSTTSPTWPSADSGNTVAETQVGGSIEDASVLVGEGERELTLDGAPLYSDYVRLTHLQWENSVVDNLRLDAPTGQFEILTPDPTWRYSNNEAVLSVVGTLVEDYQTAAESIAQRIVTDAAALDRLSVSRDPATFIAEVGRRFYRRPLTSAEQAAYGVLFETGATLADGGEDQFAAGVRLLLQAWMQAPSFLYRVEHSEGLLDGYEVATRLSYLLTDSTPSESLLDAAAAGALGSVEGVAAAASELLQSPRAAFVFRRFHGETYGLSRVKNLQVDAGLGLEPDLNDRLLEASNRFFDRLLAEGLGLRELLSSEVVYADPTLATLYGVPAPASGGFEPIEVGGARRGFFAQLPLLMVDSEGTAPNPFVRGSTLATYVLCQPYVAHPQDVPFTDPLDGDSLTNRQYTTQLVSEPACMACHQYFDPLGYAFENFDGLGRERATDNGFAVDTTGVYPFAEGPQFADSKELMAILAQSRLAHGCYAKQLAEFGLARGLSPQDASLVEGLQNESLQQNASLTDLVVALVTSETFRSAGVAP